MLRFAIDRKGFKRAGLTNDIRAALGNQANVLIDDERDEDFIYVSIGEHNESDYDIFVDWWCGFGSKK